MHIHLYIYIYILISPDASSDISRPEKPEKQNPKARNKKALYK